eukprot:TRINITY_DN997_c0_g1_i1.p1 TRINITY_DN997_c0_g1~~TRINITY_DN997_c0_g1_i1.p1  ORF type:complete len:939 (-),score=386.70 TRINITY_DN997_c0_g1_i1:123-2939(-)
MSSKPERPAKPSGTSPSSSSSSSSSSKKSSSKHKTKESSSGRRKSHPEPIAPLDDAIIPDEKNLLVIGANSQVGSHLSKVFATEGWNVGLVDLPDSKDALAELSSSCSGTGAPRSFSLTADFTKPDFNTRTFVADVKREFRSIKLLLMLDGIQLTKNVNEISSPVKEAQKLLELNFYNQTHLIVDLLPLAIPVNGHFVISTLKDSKKRLEGTAPFRGAKRALEAFVLSYAKEETRVAFSVLQLNTKAFWRELGQPSDGKFAGEFDPLNVPTIVKGITEKVPRITLKTKQHKMDPLSAQVSQAEDIANIPDFSSASAPAICQAILNDDKGRVKALLKAIKVDISSLAAVDEFGRNAMHFAAFRGNTEAVTTMVKLDKKRSLINAPDKFRWTPLHYAVWHSQYKMCTLLIKSGADPNALTMGFHSCVHFLATKVVRDPKLFAGLEKILKSLLEMGAESNQRNFRNQTPLHLAALTGATQVLEILIRNEGDVHRRTKEGETPLHCAVAANHIDVVKILLKAGADPGSVSEQGDCFALVKSDNVRELMEEYREQNRRNDSDFENVAQREIVIVDTVEEFSEDVRKMLTYSDLTDNEPLYQNWDILLYVLRFLTRKTYRRKNDDRDDPTLIKKPPQSKATHGLSIEESAERFINSGNPKKMFKIIEDAGRGGFGSVFVAKSLVVEKDKNRSRVAIKKMPHVTDKEVWSNYDEIFFLKEINHPCIVRFYSAYICRDELWLTMEYMEGGTLQDAVTRTKLEETHIAYVTKEILRGLRYLHEKGYAHRDLKSANIMLSIFGDVKLIDFGLCVDVRTGPLINMVGSPFWIPPEMIQRKAHGCPADIWSLAILCLEMANQRPPNRRSALKAMFLVGSGITPWFEDDSKWSPAFKSFLRRMLVIDPSQRADSEELLKDPWMATADNKKGMRAILQHIFIERSLETSLGI